MSIHDIKENFSNSFDGICLQNTSFSLAIAGQMNYMHDSIWKCLQDNNFNMKVSSIRQLFQYEKVLQ